MRNRLSPLVVLSAALCFAASPASAAVNLIVNGGFESGPGGSLPVLPGSTALTGWTILTGSVDSAGGFQTHDGSLLCVDLDGYYAVGSMSQNVNVLAGQQYLLDFWMAGNPDGAPTLKAMNVLWGGVSLGTFTFDVTGKSLANMGWVEHQLVISATGPLMTLKFASLDTPADNAFGPMIDDVSLTPVPEPGSMTLLGAGLAGATWLRRRRVAKS